MIEIKNCKKKPLLATLIILFFISPSFAQLKADFSIDKNGGCSPLTVSFTSTTTGASPTAIYSWDFGNGNTSALMNAGATYVDAQTYNITLTVTDAGKSSTQTKQVTVYKRPTVDFSFDIKKGCLPLPVNFIASAAAGDGSIASYYWDFGDGSTQESYSSQIQHTYNFVNNSEVGLTVTNSYGCYTSIQKPATIVLPAMQAAFGADNLVLCNITDPIQFSNSSSGPGSLSYAWDFGDGTNSSATSPSHVYNKKGTYSVSLTVSNADGCKVVNSQANYVNVKNFSSDFSVPQLICKNDYSTFTDNSTPGATSKLWLVDGLGACNYCNYGTFSYTFSDLQNHKVQLINTYGKCSDSSVIKPIIVNDIPVIQRFIEDMPFYCKIPVTVNFKDTSNDAVKWAWYLNNFYYQPTSTLQAPSITYNSEGSYGIQLTITNAVGCSATEYENLNIINTDANIRVLNDEQPFGCDSVHIVFFATPTRDSIVSYKWDFGDGFTSTDVQPQHTFTKPGVYIIKLDFVTDKGCTGSTNFSSVHVYKRPVADFTVSSQTICGNTPVTFIGNNTNSVTQWLWNFGNNYNFYNSGANYNPASPVIQYTDSGTYSVNLIVMNELWTCADTITKTGYIKVLPPFPKISNDVNTCDAMRGLVKFTESSTYTSSWKWDFGEGSSQSYTTKQDTIIHNYTATGKYKVVLSVTNGQCTVKDSLTAYVLLKQSPLLTANTTSVCKNGPLELNTTNLETNPLAAFYWGGSYYYPSNIQYGDSTNINDFLGSIDYREYWYNSGKINVTNLDPTKRDLRIITTSTYFNCQDTSNFIPLKIDGPSASFKIVEGAPCFAYPVILQDKSIAGNSSPIQTWQWDFGDGTVISDTKSNTESHVYTAPGYYYPTLKVTDANGCYSSTPTYSFPVNPSGPKSSFGYYPANVTPNSPVTFNNYTNTFQSGNTQYLWIFGDGSTSTDYSPTHTYTNVAVDTVKLIAINPDTHCRDTSIQIINVKIINTQFSFNKTYVSASACPPVIVHFTNTSSNALSVAWDFGDGSKADNQNNPSHTYYNAGTYKIIMYGYGYNGTTDTTVDSITVKAPFAKLNADGYFGCLSKTIKLTAQIQNASAFVWDFGDGTINQTKDSFSTHSYLSPGIYSPALIMTDSSGCSLLSYLDQKVVIDSLGIKINKTPAKLCGPGTVTFTDPVIFSFAEQQQQPLQYHWNFGTGNAADTSNISSPSFKYNNYGKSFMNLIVKSPYGCMKTLTDSILIVPKATASITGPNELCANGSAQFNGSSTLTDSIIWLWNFDNGNTSSSQNPPKQIFTDAKNYKVSLVINHFGCYDTAVDNLAVHPNPMVNVDPKQSILCLGKTVQLNAHDGIRYSWSPTNGLNDNKSASPIASPTDDVTYVVLATNNFNCTSTDSTSIKVAKPFTVKIPADTFVCKGTSIKLSATGANSYNWISGDGLSSTTISDPVALPSTSAAFTVVGYDAYNCFTDTETVRINVQPLPTVNAGSDIDALDATSVQLNATGSSDITQWNWMPPDNLSCVDCPSPISNAKKTTAFIVTVKNKYDCIASDTVIVKLTCTQDHVYIPSAFSPDGNGSNDVFYIKGRGVSIIKSFKVYGRWGEVVFERKNINIDDRSNGWDGNYKGLPAPVGTYVYMAELVCDTGELFVMKGTVTLVR